MQLFATSHWLLFIPHHDTQIMEVLPMAIGKLQNLEDLLLGAIYHIFTTAVVMKGSAELTHSCHPLQQGSLSMP